ncbi:chloramphenicol phosphotransferase CPT family protein [Jeongeupia chitinilytica]|uniref:O-phosphotransferase n=1 Tax=Jeongeupia chitinilytica TaxID=1041641 RepID=A0ABQ3H4P2_9NEIS|nr:AAA family ATPase [Jeongeupia chitinilytica]GHD64529.1 putative O-phosphotransferase [Jeongeupia chitinilytica]
MLPQVIVLNGCSSAGKSSLARALQERLPEQYLYFGIDHVLSSLPQSDWLRMCRGEPITRSGYDWATLVRGYHYCLPGLLQAGNRLIIDNGWCERDEKRELLTELAGYAAVLVAVRCDPAIAAVREAARGDRASGLAAWEAPRVHADWDYDLDVDTGTDSIADCADALAARLVEARYWRAAADSLERLNLG